MWIPYQKTIFKKEQLEQAAALIRELQPNCLINSRLGLPTDANYVDFQTLGDNQFGSRYIAHPWETPGTIAHSWGYSGYEKEWKSTGQLFESLIGNVALNGGFTLNIGPRADGSIPYESQSRLNDIGTWLSKYGAAVYGNTGLQLNVNQHDWGKITRQSNSNTVYLHVFNWPLDRILRVTGIQEKPSKVELLIGDKAQALTYEQNGPLLHINVPNKASDPYVSVIRVSYAAISLAPTLVAESSFGGFALRANNVLDAKNVSIKRADATRPSYIASDGSNSISWEVYLPEAGTYSVDLSAHNPAEQKNLIHLAVAAQNLKEALPPTGKVVAEPNQNNYTDEFVDQRIGTLHIEKPGTYTLSLQSQAGQSLWINRIWLAPLKR